jgi:hypothetical protein
MHTFSNSAAAIKNVLAQIDPNLSVEILETLPMTFTEVCVVSSEGIAVELTVLVVLGGVIRKGVVLYRELDS